MKTLGTYNFQNANFGGRSHYAENRNGEISEELYKSFTYELKEIYWSELILVKAFTKMLKNASGINLSKLLNKNLDTIKYHITRIEDIFAVLDEKITTKSCETVKEMIVEINGYLKSYTKGQFKDEIMTLNLQKISQFKVDSYESFYEYAKSIGENEVAAFLLESLNEEIELDYKLAEISDLNVDLNTPAYY